MGIQNSEATIVYISIKAAVLNNATIPISSNGRAVTTAGASLGVPDNNTVGNNMAAIAATNLANTAILAWSEWEIKFLVIRLGEPRIRRAILDYGAANNGKAPDTVSTMNAMEVYHTAIETLQDTIFEGMISSIVDGGFDHLVNTATYGGLLVVSSLIGDERTAFAPFASPNPIGIPVSTTPDGNSAVVEEEENDVNTQTYVGIFFAGLGAGLLVVVAFLYIACQELSAKNAEAEEAKRSHPQELVDLTDAHDTSHDNTSSSSSPPLGGSGEAHSGDSDAHSPAEIVQTRRAQRDDGTDDATVVVICDGDDSIVSSLDSRMMWSVSAVHTDC